MLSECTICISLKRTETHPKTHPRKCAAATRHENENENFPSMLNLSGFYWDVGQENEPSPLFTDSNVTLAVGQEDLC